MRAGLVINADDFGMSRGTVDTIVGLAQAGTVTSTTLMATGEAFDYAVSRVKDLGSASVGVHLDATTGVPVSEWSRIPSLIDSEGRFLQRMTPESIGAIARDELEREFRAQLDRALRAGVPVSHLDNHHNWVYLAPRLFEVVVRIARDHRLPVRYPFGGLNDERLAQLGAVLKLSVDALKALTSELGQLLDRYEVDTLDQFYIDFTSLDRSEEGLTRLISRLAAGSSEICVHPGSDTERQRLEARILAGFTPARIRELRPDLKLLSYREAILGAQC